MGVLNLYDACEQLLVVASDACASLTPGGAMKREYVSPGAPAWDCPDQLTVHAGAAVVGDTAPLQPPLQPGHRIAGRDQVDLPSLTITALRCVPVMDNDGATFPDPIEIERAARITLCDLWAIWNHVATAKRLLALFPPKDRELFFDAAIPVVTAGGIGGWQIPMRVQVDGWTTPFQVPFASVSVDGSGDGTYTLTWAGYPTSGAYQAFPIPDGHTIADTFGNTIPLNDAADGVETTGLGLSGFRLAGMGNKFRIQIEGPPFNGTNVLFTSGLFIDHWPEWP